MVTIGDIKKAIREFARCDCEFGAIWDMRQAQLGQFACGDIKDVVETIPMLLPNKNTYRVAFIGSSDFQFGLFRVFQAYAEFGRLEREYGYFEDTTEARDWVMAYANPEHSDLRWQLTHHGALSV